MKTNKIILSALAATTMLFFTTSCSKEFYTKVNVNTNQPTAVPPNTLLPGIEVSLAYAQGGDASRYSSLFVQQGFGAAREAAAYYDFEFAGTNNPEQLWDNMYATDMENDYTLLGLAKSGGYNEYAGIASVLMAYSLQVTVDFWGNIPYSQAFMGTANPEPSYDIDKTIYGNILTLLDAGIADLSNANKGNLYPTTDDIMYGGNEASWINFANAIKARVYIHQCKGNSVTMCDSALACATRALGDGFAIAQLYFVSSPNSAPQYQYNTDWGDISYVDGGGVTPTMYDSMYALSDPRINVFFDTAGSAGASTPIVGMDPTCYYGQQTSPVEFISKEELDFIQAEATLRLGGTVAAASVFYNNAITDNFTKLGLAGAAAGYEANTSVMLPSTNAGAQYEVAKQEWIALFLNPEAWACWRRTGSPALVAPVGAVSTEIPRRMVLPNSEVTENSHAPAGETMWTPQIFWDAL